MEVEGGCTEGPRIFWKILLFNNLNSVNAVQLIVLLILF